MFFRVWFAGALVMTSTTVSDGKTVSVLVDWRPEVISPAGEDSGSERSTVFEAGVEMWLRYTIDRSLVEEPGFRSPDPAGEPSIWRGATSTSVDWEEPRLFAAEEEPVTPVGADAEIDAGKGERRGWSLPENISQFSGQLRATPWEGFLSLKFYHQTLD